MPDYVNITAGSGTPIAADSISGSYHQRVKLSVGADGEASDLDFGQATKANSLPVAIASDQSTVTVDSNFNGWVYLSSSAVTGRGQNVTNLTGFLIKGHPNNVPVIYVFYNGGTSASGFPLGAGESFPYSGSSLYDLQFGHRTAGESACACWIKV